MTSKLSLDAIPTFTAMSEHESYSEQRTSKPAGVPAPKSASTAAPPAQSQIPDSSTGAPLHKPTDLPEPSHGPKNVGAQPLKTHAKAGSTTAATSNNAMSPPARLQPASRYGRSQCTMGLRPLSLKQRSVGQLRHVIPRRISLVLDQSVLYLKPMGRITTDSFASSLKQKIHLATNVSTKELLSGDALMFINS
jgi:hypothetical protein